MATEHKAGELAYLDTFAGLVPCKVLDVQIIPSKGAGFPVTYIKTRVTAKRGAYERGDIIESTSRMVVPRENIRVRNGKYTIVGLYRWV